MGRRRRGCFRRPTWDPPPGGDGDGGDPVNGVDPTGTVFSQLGNGCPAGSRCYTTASTAPTTWSMAQSAAKAAVDSNMPQVSGIARREAIRAVTSYLLGRASFDGTVSALVGVQLASADGVLLGDHDYIAGPNLICAASAGCTAAEVGAVYSQVQYGIPGGDGDQKIVSGNTYPVRIFGVYIGDVKSYVGSGGLTISNVTLPNHALHSGWINRNAIQLSSGAWYSITHGKGTNYYGGAFNAAANQWGGPRQFNAMDKAIRNELEN